MLGAETPAPSSQPAFRLAPVGYLSEGYRLGSAVRDPEGGVLLPAGVVIDDSLIRRLRADGSPWVSIELADWEAIKSLREVDAQRRRRASLGGGLGHSPATRELDAALHAEGLRALAPEADPFARRVQQHGATPYHPNLQRVQAEQHRATVNHVKHLVSSLDRDQAVDGEQLQQVSHGAVEQAAKDLDLFVSLGIDSSSRETLFDHSASVSRLAVAMGARLGLAEQSLVELGAGCLVHDAGMLRIQPGLTDAARPLTAQERIEVAKHPIIATDLLYKNAERVPVGVRMVVYQMHERCDGSGYPRGCVRDEIHPLARVAAVADSYIAMISQRPYREAWTPYRAVESLLRDTAQGLYDPSAMRSLLQAISLFPIGSLVQLSDGRVAKVRRANGQQYDRPVVEAWALRRGPQSPELVDLAAQDLRVQRSLAKLRDALRAPR
ncbi:MAG: HD domain-containing phosphohydrolase [Planctomycetota bacterium]